MKRILFFLMLIFLILTIIAGFTGAGEEEDDDGSRLHVIAAVVFAALSIVHLWINRKTVVKYIRGK
jgi:Ca2+/H+ antiporter